MSDTWVVPVALLVDLSTHRPGAEATAAECCRLLGVNPKQYPQAVAKLAEVIDKFVNS